MSRFSYLQRAAGRIRGRTRTATEVVRSRRRLRDVTTRGRWSRVQGGRLIIRNEGTIVLGERVRFMCQLGPSSLRVGPGATLSIGDRSAVNYGTDIVAAGSVTLGRGVSLGPRCIVGDSLLPLDRDPGAIDHEPIVIEDDVWLATRVTVMPGAKIGHGTVVTAGSVVTGELPPRVVAGGNPIRILRRLDGDGPDVDVPIDIAADGGDDSSETTPPERATSAAGSDTEQVGDDAETVRCLLVSDFTIDQLGLALGRRTQPIRFDVEVAPFGAVVPTLLAPPDDVEAAVVWTRPEAVLTSFRTLLDGGSVTADELRADVDGFARLLSTASSNWKVTIVPTWTIEPWRRGAGHLDAQPGGLRWALGLANARLVDALEGDDHAVVVDADRWLASVGPAAYSERSWFLGKVPFADSVFELAADATAEVTALLIGKVTPRKLVVVDLDNTVWGGVVGDDGIEGIRLGGHDARGEAFAAFQRSLSALRGRGIVLAIVSKNDESVALDAIDHHEQMVLRRDDFVTWRINWNDKAANIASIVDELNIGLQSVVFIDDNPHERERVRSALPEVLVPEWPEEPTAYVRALDELSCFDVVARSEEDAARTELYAAERERTAIRAEVGNIDDWLAQLGIEVRVDLLDEINVVRAAQLLNKTNQMNLTTRRLAQDEFLSWSREPGHVTACLTVSDQLGDAGLTGIASIAVDGDTATLVDFVLSCRVMGRRIEDTMLHVATTLASEMGATELSATLLPTAKNAPCRRYFEASELDQVGDVDFVWSGSEPLSAPDMIRVLRTAEEAGTSR